ncbi:hypothetical protein SEEA0100_07568, partial [Salmonella enterica subsp. enterica serovar Anatum str. USDA 100]
LDGLRPLRLKTESVHAAVDFDINIQRRVKPRILQRFQLASLLVGLQVWFQPDLSLFLFLRPFFLGFSFFFASIFGKNPFFLVYFLIFFVFNF